MRFPKGRSKALTFSYDDGVEQDIELVAVLNKYGLVGTFNLNSGLYAPEGTVHPKGVFKRPMTEKQVTSLFTGSPHEVASHSLTHPFLNQLPKNLVIKEILQDKVNLEKQFGIIVRGGAYPFGATNDSVVNCLECAGIAYYRTTISTESFSIPNDWLRLNPTCHHKNPNLMSLAHSFMTDSVNRAPYLFYVWGHSYEFERDNNWNVIEEFCSLTAGHEEEIWYATNREIYDYIQAYNRRITSADGSVIYNPTDKELWFYDGKTTFSIKSGEIKKV